MKPVKYCLDTDPQRLNVSVIRHLGQNLDIDPYQISPYYEFIYSSREKYPYFKSSTLFLKQVICCCQMQHFSYRKFRNKKIPLPSNKVFRFVHVCKQINTKGLQARVGSPYHTFQEKIVVL